MTVCLFVHLSVSRFTQILHWLELHESNQKMGPLSLGPIPSGRLKNLKDVDKWSSLSLYLPVRGMSVTCELGLYLYSRIG